MYRIVMALSCLVPGSAVVAQNSDQTLQQRLQEFTTGIQSTDEAEFEKARALFLNGELRSVSSEQIQSVVEPLIWPRNDDSPGQIRQGKLLEILRQTLPPDQIVEKFIQLASDDSAYFYLRDSALRAAAGSDIFSPEVRALLVKRTTEADTTAIDLLGTYATEWPGVVSSLVSLQKHRSDAVRLQAFQSLQKIVGRFSKLNITDAVQRVVNYQNESTKDLAEAIAVLQKRAGDIGAFRAATIDIADWISRLAETPDNEKAQQQLKLAKQKLATARTSLQLSQLPAIEAPLLRVMAQRPVTVVHHSLLPTLRMLRIPATQSDVKTLVDLTLEIRSQEAFHLLTMLPTHDPATAAVIQDAFLRASDHQFTWGNQAQTVVAGLMAKYGAATLSTRPRLIHEIQAINRPLKKGTGDGNRLHVLLNALVAMGDTQDEAMTPIWELLLTIGEEEPSADGHYRTFETVLSVLNGLTVPRDRSQQQRLTLLLLKAVESNDTQQQSLSLRTLPAAISLLNTNQRQRIDHVIVRCLDRQLNEEGQGHNLFDWGSRTILPAILMAEKLPQRSAELLNILTQVAESEPQQASYGVQRGFSDEQVHAARRIVTTRTTVSD